MDLKKGPGGKASLPRLGQSPFVLVHWNANFCPIVPGSHSPFSALEALSHSLVLGGLHQLLLLAENLRNFISLSAVVLKTSVFVF